MGWRGDGQGIFATAQLPTTWDVESGANVAWKAALPNPSAATPVARNDAVYVLADPDQVLCLDLATGAVRWQGFIGVGPKDDAEIDAKVRETLARCEGLPANDQKPLYAEMATRLGLKKFGRPELGFTVATPLVDASGVYACTSLGVVAAYDHAGKRRWRADARLIASYPSPLLVEGLVIVSGANAMVALDPATGAERWNAKLLAGGRCGTPAAWVEAGTTYLIAGDQTVVRAKDGKVMVAEGVKSGTEAGPVVTGNRVFFTRGDDHNHGEQYVQALDLKVDGEKVVLTPAWKTPDRKAGSKVFCYTRLAPMVVGQRLLSLVPNQKTLFLEALTDGAAWDPGLTVSIPPSIHCWGPEPILAGGHLYLAGIYGQMHVINVETTPWTLVGTRTLVPKTNEKKVKNPPAVLRAGLFAVGKRLLVRTEKTLFCFEDSAPGAK